MSDTKVFFHDSPKADKRLEVIFYQVGANGQTKKKRVSFGAKNGKTFIDGRSDEERRNYIKRHAASGKEKWKNPFSPGALSRWILWEKKTLPSAIQHYCEMFGFKLIKVSLSQEIMSRRRTLAKYGTNEEVFNGEALMTKNYLTAGELLLDTSNNRVVSAASKRLPKQAKAATKYPVSVTGPGVVLAADVIRERKEKLAAEKEAKKEAGVQPKTPKASKETTRKSKSEKEDHAVYSSNSVPRVSSDQLLAARRPYREEREKEKKTEGRKRTEDKKTEGKKTAMDPNFGIRQEVFFDYDQKTKKYRVPDKGGWMALDECKVTFMQHHYKVQITSEEGGSLSFLQSKENAPTINLTTSADGKHYLYAGKYELSINLFNLFVELFDLLHWVPKITAPTIRNSTAADRDVASQQQVNPTRGLKMVKLEEEDDD